MFIKNSKKAKTIGALLISATCLWGGPERGYSEKHYHGYASAQSVLRGKSADIVLEEGQSELEASFKGQLSNSMHKKIVGCVFAAMTCNPMTYSLDTMIIRWGYTSWGISFVLRYATLFFAGQIGVALLSSYSGFSPLMITMAAVFIMNLFDGIIAVERAGSVHWFNTVKFNAVNIFSVLGGIALGVLVQDPLILAAIALGANVLSGIFKYSFEQNHRGASVRFAQIKHDFLISAGLLAGVIIAPYLLPVVSVQTLDILNQTVKVFDIAIRPLMALISSVILAGYAGLIINIVSDSDDIHQEYVPFRIPAPVYLPRESGGSREMASYATQ